MSWLAIVSISMFSSNALLSWGLGFRTAFASSREGAGMRFLIVLLFAIVAAAMLWGLSTYIVMPLGLQWALPLAYMLFVVPTLRLMARGFAKLFASTGELFVISSDELTISTLVFGMSLLAVRTAPSLPDCLLAAASAAIGWAAAVTLLGAIVRRSEAGPVPRSMSGIPLLLVSAALAAMVVALATSSLALGAGR